MKKTATFLLIFLLTVVSLFGSQDSKKQYELALSKKLLYETARILESQDNMLILDEIYDYDWYPSVDIETSLPYITDFRTYIDNFRSIEQRRELMIYLNNQQQAMAISSLVPNALSVATIAFSVRNPLSSLIAIAGTALSSYSSYTTAKQQNELKLIQQEFELNEAQETIFNDLYNRIFSYLATNIDKYGFSNEDFASTATIRDFIKDCNANADNPSNLLLKVIRYESELSIFPEYWAVLATSSYEIGDYQNALRYIDEYDKVYVQTMYHDNARAKLKMIEAYCINELWENSREKVNKLDSVISEILSNSNSLDWAERYYCVCIYKEMEEISQDVRYLSLAQSLLRDIVNDVADKYSEDLTDYLSGAFIQNSLNGIDENISRIKEAKASEEDTLEGDNLGKTRKNQIKENIEKYDNQIKELEENKKEIKKDENQMLPPNAGLLVSLTYEYSSLSKELGKTSEQSYSLLVQKVDSLLYDIYSRNLLFDEPVPTLSASINYDHRVPVLNVFRKFNGDDIITITIPLRYFTTQEPELNSKEDHLYLLIENFEYELTNWSYEIQRADNLDNYYVVIKATINDPIETGVSIKDGATPLVRIRFSSISFQFDEPIVATVDKPSELLKGFKVQTV